MLIPQDEALHADNFVMVHAGYAPRKTSEHETLAAWELHHRMLAATRT